MLIIVVLLSGFNCRVFLISNRPTLVGKLLKLASIYAFVFSFQFAYAEKITVVTEYLPPFQQANDDGSLGGYATEVLHALFALTGDEADIQVIPWARAYDKALKEPNVLIYSIAHTKERARLFHWIGALRYENFYFWGLKTKFTQPFQALSELKAISIAAPNGHNSDEYLTSQGFTNIYRVVKSDQQVQMLYHNRVDMVLGNSLIIKSQAQALGYSPELLIKLMPAYELNNSLDIALSKSSDPNLVKRLQKAFRHLIGSGKLAEIKAKWSIADDLAQVY